MLSQVSPYVSIAVLLSGCFPCYTMKLKMENTCKNNNNRYSSVLTHIHHRLNKIQPEFSCICIFLSSVFHSILYLHNSAWIAEKHKWMKQKYAAHKRRQKSAKVWAHFQIYHIGIGINLPLCIYIAGVVSFYFWFLLSRLPINWYRCIFDLLSIRISIYPLEKYLHSKQITSAYQMLRLIQTCLVYSIHRVRWVFF